MINKRLCSISFLIALTSCGLLYNPDFADKVGVGTSGAEITGAGDIIGPGTGSISGSLKSYLKSGDLSVSIDGSNYTVNYKYPDWTISLSSLPCGPHTVVLTLKGSDGNVTETKSFTYNVPAYVATNGNDANAGNYPANAFLSIQKGVDSLSNLNGRNGYVYIASGTFTPGIGLSAAAGTSGFIVSNNNTKINGGWNQNFTAHSGISILDRQNNINGSYVISILNCNNIQIDGLMLINGFRGIMANQINNCLIGNIIIQSNNRGIEMTASMNNHIIATISFNSNSTGGGILLNNSSWNTISGFISYNNNSANSGGGIGLWNSYSNTVSANIFWNKAGVSSGGIYISGGGWNNILGDTLSNAASYCAGIELSTSSYNIISGNIGYNIANGSYVGGLGIFGGTGNVISGRIYNNSTVNNGGGVYMQSTTNNTISGVIASNTFSLYGGGVYIFDSYFNKISGMIYCNSNTSGGSGRGGGVYMITGNGNIISGDIISNMVPGGSQGGGIYCDNSQNYSISGNIIGNYSGSSYAGGIYILSGSGTISSRLIAGNRCSGHAAGLYVSGITNAGNWTYILSSVITNNLSTGGSYPSGVKFGNCTNYRGLIVSNCVIGGTNATSYGISEEGSSMPVINHVLVDNTFITSLMQWFYYDTVNGNSASINDVNSTAFTGAAEAHGNRAQ